MNIQEVFAAARMQHIRNVMIALGPDRIEKAMTAFDNGSSSWSECFFARAFKGELKLTGGNPEQKIKEALGLPTLVPIRFVWHSFDSIKSTGMTRKDLKRMIEIVMSDLKPATLSAEDQALMKKTYTFVSNFNFDQKKPGVLECALPMAKL